MDLLRLRSFIGLTWLGSFGSVEQNLIGRLNGFMGPPAARVCSGTQVVLYNFISMASLMLAFIMGKSSRAG